MSRSRAAPLLIALLSVSTLGFAATSMEATLTTDPDEAIDLDWDRLPISEGDAAAVKDEIRRGDGEDTGAPAAEDGGSGDGGGGSASGDGRSGASGDGGDAAPESRDGDGGTDGSGGGGEGAGVDSAAAPFAGDSELPDRLSSLRVVLAAALVALVALVAAALAYRYRERLRAAFGAGPRAGGRSADGEPWPGTEPSNPVDGAWVAMVRRLEPARPETTTAAECRRLARERHLDVEAVDAIATAFERVHYGDAAVAEEAERARAGLRRLDEGDDE
ncbi:DUF4129 domain-containing protein [Halobacteriales archaeon QS_6_71_20]|nr:MAG: DUF4129 domain-containing protein [Halobacteriales archaeon QS_6_71_20]